MATYNIQLEGSERDALLQLLDMTIKSHGFKVAEAAVVLGKKIAAAPEFHQATEVPPNEVTDSNEP